MPLIADGCEAGEMAAFLQKGALQSGFSIGRPVPLGGLGQGPVGEED